MKILAIGLLLLSVSLARSGEKIAIWPDLAPGETVKQEGVVLPARGEADPPIVRVGKITHPTMEAFLPEGGGNGAAVVVLPGGGFGYVVPNLEGSETAVFLNRLGISVFVLSYRTKLGTEQDAWRRPLQDSQRAIRFLRMNAARWKLNPDQIGLLAFSAGGQVGAIHIGESGDAYDKIDAVDERSARPDFVMLIYPWNVGNNATGELMDAIKIGKTAPPTFLVHTDDDKSSALGAASIYKELKKAGVSAELHVYQNGGHGYGIRARQGSVIGTWKERASDWLEVRGIGKALESLEPMSPRDSIPVDERQQVTKMDLLVLRTALNVYRLDEGEYPSTQQGLKALVEKPTSGKIPKNWRASLTEVPLDPWGNPYGYRYPSEKNREMPDLFSSGADGKLGTADDVTNWSE